MPSNRRAVSLLRRAVILLKRNQLRGESSRPTHIAPNSRSRDPLQVIYIIIFLFFNKQIYKE